ncbi:MAG: MFS transporter [Acidimicrobiales bacterium]
MAFMSGTFAALQHRDYRMLWSGSVLATTAFMMSFMLIPSVAFEITGSNASAGFAQMGSGIGMFVVSPIGGVIADRLRKKPLVLAGQAVPALVILSTGILILTDTITIPFLTIATLIMGLGFAFMGPARQA